MEEPQCVMTDYVAGTVIKVHAEIGIAGILGGRHKGQPDSFLQAKIVDHMPDREGCDKLVDAWSNLFSA
ncbi:hypothetical protein OH492_28635 [Vibrio chagasii]|nr:hypothetical protein [Vibrio chagasii]